MDITVKATIIRECLDGVWRKDMVRDFTRKPKAGRLTFSPYALPDKVLEKLSKRKDIPKGDQEKIVKALTSDSVDAPDGFVRLIQRLPMTELKTNAEVRFNGRWYPIRLHANYESGFFFGASARLTSCAYLVGRYKEMEWRIRESAFLDNLGAPIDKKLDDILAEIGIRKPQMPVSESLELLSKARDVGQKNGEPMDSIGPIVCCYHMMWYMMIESESYGSEQNPRTCVVESELEITQDEERNDDRDDENVVVWPFIRVFAMDKKQYVRADIRDVAPHKFQEDALSALVVPDGMRGIMQKAFNTPVNELFGDANSRRSGGMVVLAKGNPGVGKTLTAEVFAEHSKRVLYCMEVAELGISPTEMEASLQRIFLRASRWNAVLLLDEADIFMAERGMDLERNAIVGIFLRLLDFYKGMFFLTTNRGTAMDPAFASRVTVKLDYPDLDKQARVKVWNIMLAAAGVKVDDVDRLADMNLNGREIRNMVRLARAVFGSEAKAEEVAGLQAFGTGR